MPSTVGPSSIPPSYSDRGDSTSPKVGIVTDALAGKSIMPQVSAESLRTSRSSGVPLEISSGDTTPHGSKIDPRELQDSLRRLADLDPSEDFDALYNEALGNQKKEKIEKHKSDLLEMGLDRLSATTSNTFSRTIKNKLLDIKLAVISFRHEKALNKLDKELARTSFNRPNLQAFQELGKNNVLQGQPKASIPLKDMKEALANQKIDLIESPANDLTAQVLKNIQEGEDLKDDLAAAEQILYQGDNFQDLDDLIDSLAEDEEVDFNADMDAAERLLDRQDLDDLIDSLPMDDPEDFSDLDFSKKSPVTKNIEPLVEDIKPKAGTWEARGEVAPENKVSELKKKFEDLK